MPDYQPIDYRLRCHSKRTDLPADVLRDIGEAYAEIERLEQRKAKILAELDAARREVCSNQAMLRMQRHYVHRESEEGEEEMEMGGEEEMMDEVDEKILSLYSSSILTNFLVSLTC